MIIKSKNITLDQFPDEQIDIKLSVLDVEEYSSRSTSSTKDFLLPGTIINNEFFNSLYQLDKVGDNFNPNIKTEAVFEDGGKIIFKGLLQLINIIKSNNGVNYNVQIIGNVKQMVDILEGLNLSDLDLSEYNHIRNLENITNSWQYKIKKNGQDVNTHKEGYVYPQIVYDEKQDFNSTYIFDYRPSVFVKTIIDSIFQTAGIEYSSSFFNTEYFKSLIIPMSDDEFSIDEEDVKERTSIVGMTEQYRGMSNIQKKGFPNWWYNYYSGTSAYKLNFFADAALTNNTQELISDGQPLQFNDENNNFFRDKFTAPKSGFYQVDINLNVVAVYFEEPNMGLVTSAEFKEGNARYRWLVGIKRTNGQIEIIERNNVITNDNPYHTSVLQPSTTASVPIPFIDVSNNLKIIATNRQVFLNEGDQIVIKVGFRNESLFFKTSPQQNISLAAQLFIAKSIGNNASFFSVKPKDNKLFGNEKVILNQILPKMTMLNFFQNIVRMFNLMIDEDKFNNRLIIEPYSDYYLGGEEKDWTNKHNIDEELSIELTTDVKEYNFSYDSDSDLVNEKYETEYKDKIYGDFSLSTDNEFATEIQEIKLNFAATPTTNKKTENRVQPYFVKDKDGLFEKTNVKPRILFYGGLIDCKEYTIAENDVQKSQGLFSVKDKYAYSGIWDKPYNPINSLEFDFSNAVYYDSEPQLFPLFNLFNKFHQFAIKDKISQTFRRIEGEFYLTKKDIAETKLNDIIKYKNRKYRIIEITYQTTSTNELLSNVILESIDSNDLSIYQPVEQIGLGVCPSNIVTKFKNRFFVLETFDGQNLSEECCNNLGGDFRNGVCFAHKISERERNPPFIFEKDPQPPINGTDISVGLPRIPFLGDIRVIIKDNAIKDTLSKIDATNNTYNVINSVSGIKRPTLYSIQVIKGGDINTKIKASSCEYPRIINGNLESKFLT